MAQSLANYQCPNCGGPLKFDPASQKLSCEYCGSSFTESEVQAFFHQKEETAAQAGLNYESESDEWTQNDSSMRSYNCPSCGAVILADENTAVTTCPYCNNPTVIAAQFVAKKPKYVLPFEITKQQAIDALDAFYKDKPFLPPQFRDRNHIEEIKGVYVPFWLYDAIVEADAHYQCQSVQQFHRGDDIITETSHFQVVRKGTLEFNHVPSDASTQMPDEYMDAIEPFQYEKLREFSSSYMAGYMADSYDVSATENQARVDERMRNTAVAKLRETVLGYSSVVPLREDIYRIQGKAEYAFLPVWMLSTKFKDKNYLFAVNGQTGKVIGDLPADNGKLVQSTIKFTLLIFIILAVVSYFVMVGEF